MSKDNQDLAEERTDWAEDRTIMANERTFASWMGTGLGAIGVAIGLKAVFGDFDPTWAAKTVASMFLIVAILIFWSAQRQACKTWARLTQTDAEATPSRNFRFLSTLMSLFLSTLMSLAAAAVGAVLWSL